MAPPTASQVVDVLSVAVGGRADLPPGGGVSGPAVGDTGKPHPAFPYSPDQRGGWGGGVKRAWLRPLGVLRRDPPVPCRDAIVGPESSRQLPRRFPPRGLARCCIPRPAGCRRLGKRDHLSSSPHNSRGMVRVRPGPDLWWRVQGGDCHTITSSLADPPPGRG